MTQTISLKDILITSRQREDLGSAELEQLKNSIKEFGILSPVLLRKEDNRLIAGGRRCEAARQIGLEEIPCVFKENLSDSQLSLLELIENIHRKQLNWQEECLGIEKTFLEKSREMALGGQGRTLQQTAELLGYSAKSWVYHALQVAKRLRKDEARNGPIWGASSINDALKVMVREQEDVYTKAMATSSLAPVPTSQTEALPITDPELNYEKAEAKERYLFNPLNDPEKFEEYWEEKLKQKEAQSAQTIQLSRSLVLSDCLSFMSERGEGFCHHIITDIPYAIEMSNLDQQNEGTDMSTVAEEHDVEENLDLFVKFFPAAFSALRDKGFLITWCDFSHWSDMATLARSAGFAVQRWPFVWCKTSQCINQAAQYNFTKNIEVALVCRKPGAQLAQFLQTSYVSSGKDQLCEEIGHVFAKPFAVWQPLIESVSRPGDLIYEPFAGRGSGVISCLRLGRRVLATEKQDTHHAYLIENVKKHYIKSLGPDTVFA